MTDQTWSSIVIIACQISTAAIFYSYGYRLGHTAGWDAAIAKFKAKVRDRYAKENEHESEVADRAMSGSHLDH